MSGCRKLSKGRRVTEVKTLRSWNLCSKTSSSPLLEYTQYKTLLLFLNWYLYHRWGDHWFALFLTHFACLASTQWTCRSEYSFKTKREHRNKRWEISSSPIKPVLFYHSSYNYSFFWTDSIYERVRDALTMGGRAAKSCNRRGLLKIKNKEGSLQQPKEGWENKKDRDYACHVLHCQGWSLTASDKEEEKQKYSPQHFLSHG